MIPLTLWVAAQKFIIKEIKVHPEITNRLNDIHKIVRNKQFKELKKLFANNATVNLHGTVKSIDETIDSFYVNLDKAVDIKTNYTILDFISNETYTLKINYKEFITFSDKVIKYKYIEEINFHKSN